MQRGSCTAERPTALDRDSRRPACVGPRTTWGGTVWTLPSPLCSTQTCESDAEHEDQTADGALSLNHGIRYLNVFLRAFLRLANNSPPPKNKDLFLPLKMFLISKNVRANKAGSLPRPPRSQVIACRRLPKTEAPPPQHSPERTLAQGPQEVPPVRHAGTGEKAHRCTAPKG